MIDVTLACGMALNTTVPYETFETVPYTSPRQKNITQITHKSKCVFFI